MGDTGGQYLFGTGPAPSPMAEPSLLDQALAAEVEKAKLAKAAENDKNYELARQLVGAPEYAPAPGAVSRDLAAAGRDITSASSKKPWSLHPVTPGEASLMPAPEPKEPTGASTAPPFPPPPIPLGSGANGPLRGEMAGGAYHPEADWGGPNTGQRMAQDAMLRHAIEAQHQDRIAGINADEAARGSAIERAIGAQKAQQEYDMGLPAGTEPSVGYSLPGQPNVKYTVPGLRQPGQPTIGGQAATAMDRRQQEEGDKVLAGWAEAQKRIEALKIPRIEKDAQLKEARDRTWAAMQKIFKGGFFHTWPAEPRPDPNAMFETPPATAGAGKLQPPT